MKPNGYESEGAFAMTPDPRALSMSLEPLTTLQLGSPAGQLRAAPVSLGGGQPKAILATSASLQEIREEAVRAPS